MEYTRKFVKMFQLNLTLVMVLFIASTVAQLGLNEERRLRKRSGHFLDVQIQKTREDLIRGVNCNTDCQQERDGDPVCGTNGNTYDSICDLERAICREVNVKLKHHGECSLAEKCEDDRAFRMEEVANGKHIYVPTCLADGSYAPVQCHNFTSFCWCSRIDGQLIQETISKGYKPNCSGIHPTSAPAPEPSQQDRCKGKKRKKFLVNLNKLLKEGFEVNVRGGGGRPQDVVDWKFTQLDTDGDGVLKRREYRGFRDCVKKWVEPKKCAKQFPRFCDTNHDKKLNKKEWSSCLSPTSRSGKNPRSKCRRRKNCKPKPNGPKRPKPSCERERQTLLEGANRENNSIPIYECQPNGKYQPIQCHKDICICVDELTGNSLEGTAVKNGTPDCSKPLPHAREWSGCTGENKTKFMQELKKYLLDKTEDSQRSPPTGGSSSSLSDIEYLAVYVFGTLDKNHNNFLEKKEKRKVKKLLRRPPALRACCKKLTEYCDVDKDQKVSLEEWVACVAFVPQQGVSNGGGGAGDEEIRRIEENPLHKYLIADDEDQYRRRRRGARIPPIPLLTFSNQRHNT